MAATLKDISKRTGLGLATISKYLNGGNVRPENKALIDEAIEALNYRFNAIGRSLKTGKTHIIGAIIPELSNIFMTSILTYIEDTLRRQGYGLLLADCRSNAALEKDAVEFMLSKRVDGLINIPMCTSDASLRPAIVQGLPIVLIDRCIENVNADVVLVDNLLAARTATEHILSAGHTRIGAIAGPHDIYTSQQRIIGYTQALESHGITPNPELFIYSDYFTTGGYESTLKLVREHPDMTGFISFNYDMTIGAIMAAHELGLELGKDISLIGFDDMTLSRIVRPPLTVVEQPLEEIAHHAAELLLSRLGNPSLEYRRETLEASLHRGGTVAQLTGGVQRHVEI